MRLFIGLSLPDNISAHINTLRGSLAHVNWYSPSNYHIPICFFDEIKNYDKINDLDLTMEKINLPSFEIAIQGVQHHTSPTHETYFYLNVSPTTALLNLKKKIDHSLHQFNLKPKKQHFIPHITIATGVGLTEEQIANWLYKYNLFKTEPFQLHQFSLFSFNPGEKEPHYEIEANYLLK